MVGKRVLALLVDRCGFVHDSGALLCLHVSKEVWNFTKIRFYYTRVFEFKNKVRPKVISPSFKLCGMAYFHHSYTFNRWNVRSAQITALSFVKIEFQSKI